jgi:hypothetical protein
MFYSVKCVVVAMLACCYTSQAQPLAAFTPGRHKVCSGSTVTLTNQSAGSHAYKWFINDVFYSAAVNDSVILYEPCYDLQSIKLVAIDTNNSLSDTVTAVVEVFDTCYMHYNIEMTNCIGDTVIRKTHREAIATFWDINPPVNLLSGCDTCDSVQFILSVIPTRVELHSVYEGGCSQKTTYHYDWCNPFVNGIPGAVTKSSLKIYPNPVSGVLHVDGVESGSTIELIDILGRKCAIHQLVGGTVALVEVCNLVPGVYIVKVNGAVAGRVVKQ